MTCTPVTSLPAKKTGNFGQKHAKRGRKRAVPGLKRRSYEAGDLDCSIGWDARDISADGAIYRNMDVVRGRCRDLARNDDYAKHFLRIAVANVVGPKGLKFQSRWKFQGGKTPGKLDKTFNSTLEALYRAAGKKKNIPTVCGKMSMRKAQALWLYSRIVDGEVIVMKHPGSPKNKSGFAIEFIDPARLDWMKNGRLDNGNVVKMGVEQDSQGMPVAYWILEENPLDWHFNGHVGHRHNRVPAEFIWHSYEVERAGQSRGVSLLASSALRAHLISQFEKATVIGGIVATRKVGFYKVNQESAEEYGVLGNEIGEEGGGEFCEDVNDDAALVQNVEPGMFEQLPSYVDGLESFDPDYPPANFEEFEKRMIRGMASGWGVQYHTLANDLEGVNYTSSRTGELAQRDIWRDIQNTMTEDFLEPHFEGWGSMLMFRNDIPLDKTKLARALELEAYEFIPRGWSWVDPLKEMKAHQTGLALGLVTRRTIISESTGRDFEDVIDELAEEEEYMRSNGIDPRPPDPKAAESHDDDDGGDGDSKKKKE